MKYIISSLITFFVSFNLVAQNKIMDHLSNDEKFTIIIDLLEVTELDHLLQGNENHTIIAPDNAAFLDHYTMDQLDSLKQNGLDELTNLMKHHIIPNFVDIDDIKGRNIPLYGDLIEFFIDASGTYRIVSNNNSTKMYMLTDVENGKVLESYCSILINRNESLRENSNLISYWYHFVAQNTIGLEEDLDIIDTILTSNDDITIIGLQDQAAVEDYIQQNSGQNKELFVDSLIRRHTLSGLYTLQNIYDGLVVKNWLDEDVHFSIVDDTFFVNGKEILTHYIYDDATVLRLNYPNDILEPVVISNIDENIITPAKIFPNPTHREFIIDIPDHEIISDFKIYNLQGQLALSDKEIKGQKIIDTINLMKGIYIISYKQNAVCFSKILVKN